MDVVFMKLACLDDFMPAWNTQNFFAISLEFLSIFFIGYILLFKKINICVNSNVD